MQYEFRGQHRRKAGSVYIKALVALTIAPAVELRNYVGWRGVRPKLAVQSHYSHAPQHAFEILDLIPKQPPGCAVGVDYYLLA